MRTGSASRTAITAASMRAAHLHLYDGPRIFEDTFALALIGLDTPEKLRAAMDRRPTPDAQRVAAYFALRHRYSEDQLMAALARGVRQVVLLGAGLDSFALRQPSLVSTLRYFEVDHPDSQQAKRARLAQLELTTPGVRYVPVDFATQDFDQEMTRAGVAIEPTFFAWLGVTQYIPAQAVDDTLSLARRHGRGSEIVFDVIRPFEDLDDAEREISTEAAAMSATFGEPWLSFYRPEELEPPLRAMGYSQVDWLTKAKAERYYNGQSVEPLQAWQMVSAIV